MGVQWCCWFQRRRVVAPLARYLSLCLAVGVGVSAKKFALRHCSHRVSAKKFAQHTKNGPKWVFYGALGEFFRGSAAGGAVLGELLRGNAAGGAVPGEFFADQQSWDPTGLVC